MRVVALVTVTAVAGVVPKATVEPAVKPEPVTVTRVPPATGPEVGAMAVTAGTASVGEQVGGRGGRGAPGGGHGHVDRLRPKPAGEVTMQAGRRTGHRARVPAVEPEGHGGPPAGMKLAPVTVTAVPPVRGPWVGVMDETLGPAA